MASPRMMPQNFIGAANGEALPTTPEMSYTGTYYPSTADAVTAVPVDVGEGGEVPHIDIRLVKNRVFRVRGTVERVEGWYVCVRPDWATWTGGELPSQTAGAA